MAVENTSTCKHCHEPIVFRAHRWIHRLGYFLTCKTGGTVAEPT